MYMVKHYNTRSFIINLKTNIIPSEISSHTLPNTIEELIFICLAQLYGILKQYLHGLKEKQVSGKLTKYYVKFR